jgi:hypothetical protein
VLVADWADGAISNLYPISCYRQALQNMPEDVRLYSNASDEINRALAGRAVARSIAGGVKGAGQPATAAVVPADHRSDAPLILAAGLAALLTLAASGGYLARRKWRGAARLGGPDS